MVKVLMVAMMMIRIRLDNSGILIPGTRILPILTFPLWAINQDALNISVSMARITHFICGTINISKNHPVLQIRKQRSREVVYSQNHGPRKWQEQCLCSNNFTLGIASSACLHCRGGT